MKPPMQKVIVESDPHTETCIEYATTGLMGGDSNAGGKSELVLKIGHGAHLVVNGKTIHDDVTPVKISIQVAGDWEMQGLEQGLHSLSESLEMMRKNNFRKIQMQKV